MPSAAMEITRSYVVYPGSPVIETWSSYQVTGSRAVNLSDLNAYRLLIESGRLRWITGLHTDDDRGGPFTVNEDDLDDGQTFGVGSGGRASENNVPFFSVRSGEKQFFGAMLWAGSWSLKVRRRGVDPTAEARTQGGHSRGRSGAGTIHNNKRNCRSEIDS